MEISVLLWVEIFKIISEKMAAQIPLWDIIHNNYLSEYLEYIFFYINIILILIYRVWIFIQFFYFYYNNGIIIWCVNLIIIILMIYTLINVLINNDLLDEFPFIILIIITLIDFLSFYYCVFKINDLFIKKIYMISWVPYFLGIIIISSDHIIKIFGQ